MSDLAISKVQPGELAEVMRPKKRTAFEALRGGSTFRQAAEAAGVNRATLYRWVQSDPKFRAAYNAWQQELVESSRARLLTFVEQAVEVVGKAIIRDDRKVAMGMLRQLGIMRAPNRKPTDPETLAIQMDLDHRREHYRLSEQMARHLLGKMGMTPAEKRQYIRDNGVEGLQEELQKADRKALPPGPGEGAEDKLKVPITSGGTGGLGDKGTGGLGDKGADGSGSEGACGAQPATSNSQPATGDRGDATAPMPPAADIAGAASAASAAKALSEQQIREIAEAMADEICQEAAGAAPEEAPRDLAVMANS